MLIFAIDDEPKMLALLHDAIAEAEPDAGIMDFAGGEELLSAMSEGLRPDVVFSDIELPEMNGLALAVEIKKQSPETKIIFVTGFPKYAADAFRLHANGYIVKPVSSSRVREELDHLRLPNTMPEEQEKLRVRCFGHFEVFWHGEPVVFQRKQSKELLAFLIDREGRACTSEEIAAALWENEGDMKAASSRIRRILHDLRATLREIGMEDLLIRQRRQLAVRRELLDCDYYRMLEGDMDAVNAFGGTYMMEYSWAELTTGRLQFRHQ